MIGFLTVFAAAIMLLASGGAYADEGHSHAKTEMGHGHSDD